MQHENYLGVDGGASGTRALLIDAKARVRGYGTGGNANHAGLGYDVVAGHIADAVREACASAGLALSALTFAHFALAGDDVPDDHARLSDELGQVFPGLHLSLSNDVWAGLRAGSITGAGVAVNCGSGCGAVGRNAAGRQTMIPDLGYIFGDSGGGVQIGIDAFRAVIRAWDGRGAPTMLTAALLDLTGQPDVGALYVYIYRDQLRKDAYRAATRLVFAAAAAGDPVAQSILVRVGDELGLSGATIARRLEMTDTELSYVLTGGAFRTLDSDLARAAIARMCAVAPRCQPALPLVLPVAGAALLALDGAGRSVGEQHYTGLRAQGYGWHPEERYG